MLAYRTQRGTGRGRIKRHPVKLFLIVLVAMGFVMLVIPAEIFYVSRVVQLEATIGSEKQFVGRVVATTSQFAGEIPANHLVVGFCNSIPNYCTESNGVKMFNKLSAT